jgi:hypothetical protein
MDDLQQLRDRISESGIAISEIAVGAGVKPRWLHLFVAGDIPEPGYNKIMAVRRYIDQRSGERAAA